MRIGIEPSGIPAEELIEALRRSARRCPGAICRTPQSCNRARAVKPEELSRRHANREHPRWAAMAMHLYAGAIRVFAGQDGRPRSRTDGRVRVPLREPYTGCSQTIEVWGACVRCTETANIADALVIDDNHQKIRPPRLCKGSSCRQRGEKMSPIHVLNRLSSRWNAQFPDSSVGETFYAVRRSSTLECRAPRRRTAAFRSHVHRMTRKVRTL